jgi:hypothetical protein
MLQHVLVVAYGTAEVLANLPDSKEKFLASQSLFSLGHLYERLTDFRQRNWYRELPGSLKFASLLKLPHHGELLFSTPDPISGGIRPLTVQEVTEQCEKARDSYKLVKTSTYVRKNINFCPVFASFN